MHRLGWRVIKLHLRRRSKYLVASKLLRITWRSASDRIAVRPVFCLLCIHLGLRGMHKRPGNVPPRSVAEIDLERLFGSIVGNDHADLPWLERPVGGVAVKSKI